MRNAPPEPLHPSYPNLVKKPSYGIREIARGLGISRDTIYKAINSGDLEARRYAVRCIKIPAVALSAWIDSAREDPHAGTYWKKIEQTTLDMRS